LTYLFEIIINEMMIPGQVENWIFIMDLQHMGLTSLPINVNTPFSEIYLLVS